MKLAFAHIHHCAAGETVPAHTHDVLELVYFRRGRGKTTFNNQNHTFRNNTFSILPAGTEHDEVNETTRISLCIGLYDSKIDDCAGHWSDQGGDIGRITERIFDELRETRPAHDTMLQGLLLQLTASVRRLVERDQQPPRQQALVEQALSLIRSEHGQLSVSDLSEQLFVSHDYLRHLFREYAGQSPIRHIIQTRIERAQALLAASDLSIATVAEQAGFESPYYFSRLFKQATGQTPTAYRRAHA